MSGSNELTFREYAILAVIGLAVTTVLSLIAWSLLLDLKGR